MVTSDDFADAVIYSGAAGGFGGRWFRVRNVAADDLGTFAWLLKYRVLSQPSDPIIEGDDTAGGYFRCAETMFDALARWDPATYLAVRATLRRLPTPRHLTRAERVFDLLDALASSAMQPIAAGQWCDPSLTQWFGGTAALARALTALLKQFDAAAPDLAPVVTAARLVARSIQNEIASWVTHADDRLAWAAACYCHALAHAAIDVGQPLVANMLVHRAADLFLLSLCLQHGIANLTALGPKYRYPDPGRDKVGLWNNYFYLAAANHLQRTPGRDAWLSKLNDSRNWLLYTHGTNGAQAGWVSSQLVKLADFAKAILGNDRFRQNASVFLPRLTLTASCLFDVEAGIDTYVEEVPLA